MSIPASARRKYLSNFLVIASAISVLQFVFVAPASAITPTAPSLSWTSTTMTGQQGSGWGVATSANGAVVFIATSPTAQLSTNYGVTFSPVSATTNKFNGWMMNAAMSADGQKIFYASAGLFTVLLGVDIGAESRRQRRACRKASQLPQVAYVPHVPNLALLQFDLEACGP